MGTGADLAGAVTIDSEVKVAGGQLDVALERTASAPTSDQILWVVIRNSTLGLSFPRYQAFINAVMCGDTTTLAELGSMRAAPLAVNVVGAQVVPVRSTPFPGVDAYNLLKAATEVFVMAKCGVHLQPSQLVVDVQAEEARLGRSVNFNDLWNTYLAQVHPETKDRPHNGTIPYLDLILNKISGVPIKSAAGENCFGFLLEKLTHPPLLELIWSYWHEEAMVVQGMNALSSRFQNRRAAGKDPLAHLDLDPLRPLNNILWGYIQDEQHRLSVMRRAYEYDHHYGMTIAGRAVGQLRSVDSRSRFLEGFHNLLLRCWKFFQLDDQTTIHSDAFPVLNSLKEVHYLLAQGAHNQFGDLPSTARQEMLMQLWILSRPEIREFLSGRIMVPYPEAWMDRLDAMKSLQGWTDVSVVHFRDLAMFGEQILLSIRYGAWSISNDPLQAKNWARYWRAEIQGYLHAYRAVTGVDLTNPIVADKVDAQQPSVHLRRRLAEQRRR